MNRKSLLMLVLAVGLLAGAITGMAFAFGGGNGTSDADYDADVDINREEETNSEADLAQEPDAMLEDEEMSADYDIPAISEYFPVTGTVVSIEQDNGMIRVTIEDEYGNPAVLVLSEDTVFPFSEEFEVGDTVTGWYVTNAPMILIWPAEYNIAVLAAGAPEDGNIMVDRFSAMENNEDGLMLSQDGSFAFRVDDNTQIILANGDDFTTGDIEGRRIIVIYDVSTRSIPEITTATKLIVLYEDIVTLPIEVDVDTVD